MRRYILFIAIFFLSVSCSGNDIPGDIIPVKQMKFIMYDIICAQELANLTHPKDTTGTKQNTFELSQQVFAIYKISRDDFFKSFHYYEANPDKLKILYDSLSAYSDRKRQSLYLKMR